MPNFGMVGGKLILGCQKEISEELMDKINEKLIEYFRTSEGRC